MSKFHVVPAGKDGRASKAEIVKTWYVVDAYLVHFSANSPEEAESFKAGLELAKINFDHELKQTPPKRYVLDKFVVYTSSEAAEFIIGRMSKWILTPEESGTTEEPNPDTGEPELKKQHSDYSSTATKENTLSKFDKKS